MHFKTLSLIAQSSSATHSAKQHWRLQAIVYA